MPRANEGQVPVELLTGPTKKVFTALSKLSSPDLIIEDAPIA